MTQGLETEGSRGGFFKTALIVFIVCVFLHKIIHYSKIKNISICRAQSSVSWLLLNKVDSSLMVSLADAVRQHSRCECVRSLSSQTSLALIFPFCLKIQPGLRGEGSHRGNKCGEIRSPPELSWHVLWSTSDNEYLFPWIIHWVCPIDNTCKS